MGDGFLPAVVSKTWFVTWIWKVPAMHVGSMRFLCVFVCIWLWEWTWTDSQSAGMMESGELKERQATIIDNHHRSNKSKRFIANGGFEYIYIYMCLCVHLAILFSSIHFMDIHRAILIYLSHLINVRQEKCMICWEWPATDTKNGFFLQNFLDHSNRMIYSRFFFVRLFFII